MIEESSSRGYESTTVAGVAARAGLSRADFHRQFADKQECFLGAFNELLQSAFARVAIAAQPLSPVDPDRSPTEMRSSIAQRRRAWA